MLKASKMHDSGQAQIIISFVNPLPYYLYNDRYNSLSISIERGKQVFCNSQATSFKQEPSKLLSFNKLRRIFPSVLHLPSVFGYEIYRQKAQSAFICKKVLPSGGISRTAVLPFSFSDKDVAVIIMF